MSTSVPQPSPLPSLRTPVLSLYRAGTSGAPTMPTTRNATAIPVSVEPTRPNSVAMTPSGVPQLPIVALFARSSSCIHNYTLHTNRHPALARWLSVYRSPGMKRRPMLCHAMQYAAGGCTYHPPRTLYRPDSHPSHSWSLVRPFACIYLLSPTNELYLLRVS